MDRVFICYSHQDSAFVDELTASLKAERVPIWRDVDDIPGHDTQHWWDAVLDGLKQCSQMIVVLSPDLVGSRELSALWTSFLQQGKPIYPIVYRDCDLPNALTDLPWWDFRGDVVQPIHDLLEVLPREGDGQIPPSELSQEANPKGLMALPSVVLLLGMILGVLILGGLIVMGVYWLGNMPSVARGWEALQAFTEKKPTETPTAFLTDTPIPVTPNSAALTQTREGFQSMWNLAEKGIDRNIQWPSYVAEINGVKMALVPAGCFMMGAEEENTNEVSVHEVCFDEPFWIDAYEVTNAQYGLSSASCLEESSEANQPYICVRWTDAYVHCASRGARLPTEAEWEYAARGPDNLIYPWGDTFNGAYVVYQGEAPATVGSRPEGISWIGAYDLSGNVSEWVSDDYYISSEANLQGTDVDHRIYRGGSWADDSSEVHAVTRFVIGQDEMRNDLGFRCALSYQSASEAYSPATPTPTATPSPTATPTPLPTPTTTPLPTLSQAGLENAGQRALEGVTRNHDWKPVIHELDGVKMVLVPAGCFMMGHSVDDSGSYEKPAHEVCFEKPFWIDIYEVTNEQYGIAASDIQCLEKSSEDDQPRVCIRWPDALAFCQSRGARLPTEAEWEYAARGPDNLEYPWGDDFVSEYVVYNNMEPYPDSTLPVGSTPGGESWVGAYDMSGNVWEWVNDWFGRYSQDSLPQMDPQGPESGLSHAMRGGSWLDGVSSVRTARREQAEHHTDAGRPDLGFRCARSYEP